jgi:hypothetical protein
MWSRDDGGYFAWIAFNISYYWVWQCTFCAGMPTVTWDVFLSQWPIYYKLLTDVLWILMPYPLNLFFSIALTYGICVSFVLPQTIIYFFEEVFKTMLTLLATSGRMSHPHYIPKSCEIYVAFQNKMNDTICYLDYEYFPNLLSPEIRWVPGVISEPHLMGIISMSLLLGSATLILFTILNTIHSCLKKRRRDIINDFLIN